MKNYFFFLLMALSFASCNDETVRVASFKYFNLSAFFRQEAKMLDEKKMKLNKQIVKDSVNERKDFVNVSWQKELNPFIQCDINKPAWVNSYKTDTLVTNGGMHITYTAIEENLPIRTIELLLKNNKITDIIIHKLRHNFYYQSEDFLSYQVMKGYRISGSQNVRLLNKTIYLINAVYIP